MKATFILSDGAEIDIDVDEGMNLMQAATANAISGIVGDCGGTASCATCHIYVDEAFAGLLAAPSFNEDQMLDCTAAARQPTSRLSCQIAMSGVLDGIRVTIADPQL